MLGLGFAHQTACRNSGGWTQAVLAIGLCLATVLPSRAQDDLASAPRQLSLQITHDALGDSCRRIENPDAGQLAAISLHRTFHDDFDEHPLKSGLWVPHYAGGAAWPEANY